MSLLDFRCGVEKGNRIRVPKNIAIYRGMVPGRMYLVGISSSGWVEELEFYGRL